MSEFDDFDRIFEEIIGMAFRTRRQEGGTEVRAPRREEPAAEPDELIDGKDSVTYILYAPGYRPSDFDVAFANGAISVRSPDSSVSKPLPANIETSSAVTEYKNGVFSVRMRKQK